MLQDHSSVTLSVCRYELVNVTINVNSKADIWTPHTEY